MATAALFLAGLGVQVGSQVLGGLAARNQASFEADVNRQNAKISQQAARAEAARARRDTRRRLGASRTAFAASGVTIDGSPLEVLGDQAMIGREDANLILAQGDARAFQFKADASAAKARGNNALLGGLADAGGTALTGAATFRRTFGG